MKKMLLLIIIFIGLIALKIFIFTPQGWKANLVSPMGLTSHKPAATPLPTGAPPDAAPKTFKFNSSTDLKMELQKVDPQVLDSDFE